MKVCPKCKEESPDHYEFCTRCGSKLSEKHIEPTKKALETGKKPLPPRTPKIRPALIWGSLILSVGLVMLGYSFVTVNSLIGRSFAPEALVISFISVIIMLAISLFLVVRGIKLVRE